MYMCVCVDVCTCICFFSDPVGSGNVDKLLDVVLRLNIVSVSDDRIEVNWNVSHIFL